MRSLLLDLAGYRSSVFEWVGGDATAKNLMISAVRRDDAEHRDARETDALRARLRALAATFGVESQRLAELMGEDLVDAAERPRPGDGGDGAGDAAAAAEREGARGRSRRAAPTARRPPKVAQ